MEQNAKKTSPIIGFIIVAIIFLVIGYVVALLTSGSLPEQFAGKEKIIQEIKERLIEGKVINPEPEEILILSGTVKEIGEDYLAIVPSIRQDPFGDMFPATVKVLVDENTKIEKWTLKNPSELEGVALEEPMEPYDKETAQLGDIDLGYFVLLAKSETNIKGLNEFTAAEINFSIENPFE